MHQPSNRRAILQALAAGLALSAEGKSAEVPDQIVHRDQARIRSESFGDVRNYVQGETAQLKGLSVGSIDIKPGQSPHPPHTHPEEELMLVTEGHAEISLEGKIIKVGPGGLMYAGANRLHGIVNTSAASMRVFWVKWMAK